MMPGRILVIILIFSCLSVAAHAESDASSLIRPLQHPEISGNRICAVSGRGGIRAWGLRNRLFVEKADNSIQLFTADNSPIAAEGTITDVAVINDDIWVAQTAPSKDLGLLKFDGTGWQTFREPDAVGLLNNEIVDIHVDADENLWFGHRHHGLSQLVYLVNPTFKSHNKILHLFDNELLTSFMQLTHLWIGTANGIVRLRTELKSNFELNVDKWLYPEFPAREAFSICDYLEERVVAGTSRGLAIYDGKTWKLNGRNEGVKALPATHLQRDGDHIWIGSPAGLQHWSSSDPGRIYTEADGLPSNQITALTLDETGNLLIGTESGAAMIPAKR